MRYLSALPLFFVLFAHASGQGPRPEKIKVRGVELHYIERGQGEPVVLLHGGAGDYRSWGPQIEAFAPVYRVISYSRRYHYPNQNRLTATNHSALVEAEDLAALLKKLNLKKVHLVGQSYGAFTALVFALKHPEAVRTLVLGEPPVHQLIRNSPEGEAAYQDFMARTWNPSAEAFRKGEDIRAADILALGISGVRISDLPPAAQAARSQNPLSMKSLALSSDPFPNISGDELKRLKVPALILTEKTRSKFTSSSTGNSPGYCRTPKK